MKRLSLDEFASVVGGQLQVNRSPTSQVQHVSIHSDRLRERTAFFALQGKRVNGHSYVRRAAENGAVACVVSRADMERSSFDRGAAALVVVDDVLIALHMLASWWRSQLENTRFVVVSGNLGKTVTKDALAQFAGVPKDIWASPGSFNSLIGVPLSIIECSSNAKLAIVEASVTAPGTGTQLAAIIRANFAIFTNVGTRFQSNFETADTHAQELAELARTVDESGWVLVGTNSANLRREVGASTGAPTHVYGRGDSIPAVSPSSRLADSTKRLITFPNGETTYVTVGSPSEHIADDVCLAITAAHLLGVSPNTIARRAAGYLPTSARMEVWRSPSGLTVLRDVASTDGATFGEAVRLAFQLATPTSGDVFVVLLDEYRDCPEAVAYSLGRTIALAGVSNLCTLVDQPAHSAIQRGYLDVSPTGGLRAFDSVEAIRQYLNRVVTGDDVILAEAPRVHSLSDLSHLLVQPIAPTRLYVDEVAIQDNVAAFRRLIGPSVQLLAMVKALGYGTDSLQMALRLQEFGVDALATATVDEAVALRRGGVALETILVTLASPNDFERMHEHRITPLIYSTEMLTALVEFAKTSDQPVGVHLEVDTGMHRTGLDPDEAIKAIRELRDAGAVQLTGLMTHFACADMASKDEFTRSQIEAFERVSAAVEELAIPDVVRHAANTAGALRFPEAHYDMVRIGIGMLGVLPSPECAGRIDLSPTASLVSRIMEMRDIAAGERVGYGATYQAAPGGARIAVVAGGYHDSVPRSFSDFGSVVVNDSVCRVVGRVSMDSMTILVTGAPDAAVGTDVLIYGKLGASEVPIEDVASSAGTIPYELLVSLGPRVQRIFTRH